MKIARNGIEYNLTESELFQAFQEYQHKTDIENIDLNMDSFLSEEELEKCADNKEFISAAAYSLRDFLDDDIRFDDAIERAFRETLEEFRDE